MSEEPERTPFQPPTEKVADDHRRDFNPMKTYFELVILIFGVYALYYILGLEVLIMITLAVLIYIFRETYYILDYYSYGFARKAAVFNALHASAWFIVFAINAYSVLQFGYPLIWPEFESLTQTSPLFVLTSAFGSRNIIRMYKPSDEMILDRKKKSSGAVID
ncbi:MAG: hypothetical protein P1Q69_14440 [Candidatus Thorarchaeota archaeon]|nr:hypothetical protein [Candidatus Thorarchaeota archaeon]